MILHINALELIEGITVENDRVEYKKGWNPAFLYLHIITKLIN